MERSIDHDEARKIVQMLKKKSCGLSSVEYTYRTNYFNVRYVNSYGQHPYLEITLRYKNDGMNIIRDLGSTFTENSLNEPLFYIDNNYCYWDDVLEIQKKKPDKQISKIRLNTYEQLEYLLSKDETL